MAALLLPWLRFAATFLAGWALVSLLTAGLVVSWLRLRAASQATREQAHRQADWQAAAGAPALGQR